MSFNGQNKQEIETDRLILRYHHTCKNINNSHCQFTFVTPTICSYRLAQKYRKYDKLTRFDPCLCANNQQNYPFEKTFTIYNPIQKVLTKSIKTPFADWHRQEPLPIPEPTIDNYSSSDSEFDKLDFEGIPDLE